MKITKKLLEKHNACNSGMDWVAGTNLIGLDHDPFINALMIADKYTWANWLIVRLMTKQQKVMYAVFAAKQVIGIFEKKYPNDNRPRKAIEAAEAYLKNPCKKTKSAAYDAAAYAAAYAAYATADAYAAAAAAAYAAAYTAADAAAYTAADAAAAYAADATAAAYAMKKKIINYGLKLLKPKPQLKKIT